MARDPLTLDLGGRTALVTGGSRGIGAATARLLVRAGARVMITYRSRKADADAVLATATPDPRSPIPDPPIAAVQADLTNRDDAERAVQATVKRFGALDLLVANHGIWPDEDVPLSAMTDEQWHTTLRVNVDGVFFVCRAALRAMRGPGRIVIVTSTAAQRGEGFHADYAASKGALVSFVKSLAVEAAPQVTVNSVAPGWVDTEMAARPYAGGGRAAIERGIPLGRVATPEDIAGPIVFLCSDLARHITGEILNVNGGSVLCG